MINQQMWLSTTFGYNFYHNGNCFIGLWVGVRQPITFVRVNTDACSCIYNYGMDSKGDCDTGKPIRVTRREWL
jgi:hypothetical protein